MYRKYLYTLLLSLFSTMTPEENLINERIKKLNELNASNIDPYPYSYDKTHDANYLNEKYSYLKNEEKTEDFVSVAGRIILLRGMGKATFLHILDGTGKVQGYIRQDDVGIENYSLLKKLDIGDFIGIKGKIFKTRTGEVTVYASELSVLCKALRPLPEKFHGLKDDELRHRMRYLDLIVNPENREIFRKRAIIINSIRETLNSRNYLEVDTPCIQPIYGGANAKPFKTHLNSLNMDVYLRISNELYLKRLIVGGFEKVYEFARDFRNEDIDRTHNPEFTQVEAYQAYSDYYEMMELVEDIYVNACKAVNNGSTIVKYGEHEINFEKPWKRMTMIDAIKEYGKINVEELSDDELRDIARKFYDKDPDDLKRGELISEIFSEFVEEHLIQPTFIIDHPIETTPLCKPLRTKNKHFVERFEPFVAGMEIANAYSELNDPILQRKLLTEQAEKLRGGSLESHPMDEDFIRAIEYGMPPTGGVGIGVDRMVMLLTNNQSIREVILFPFMKKEE